MTYTVESRYLEPSLTRTKIDFPWITAILLWVTRTLDNSNLPLTRSIFLFPFRSFLCNFDLDNSTYVLRSWQVEKKEETVYCRSETLNLIEIKTTVYSFAFTFFVGPVQIQCPALYINQALSLVISFDSFFKIPGYLFLPLKLSVHGTYFNCIPSQSSFSYFRLLASNSP